MKGTKVTSAMPSPLPAGNDGLRLNLGGLPWESVMSTVLRARMATLQMRMRMRWKQYCKPLMDQRRMWRAAGTVGLTCEPVMSTGLSARMTTMRIQMRRENHSKLTMNQHRMWRTVGIVLESVNIGQYISDRQNTTMGKQIQRQVMYLKRRLLQYVAKSQT